MLSVNRLLGHKEYANVGHPGRKSDPKYDMAWRRARVANFTPRGSAAVPTGDDMPLTDDDLRKVHDSVWFGASGARLITNRRLGRGEWAETILGSLEGRFANGEIALPAVAALEGKIAGLTSALQQLAAAPGQAVDLAAVTAAAEAGAEKALTKGVDVNVSVGGTAS